MLGILLALAVIGGILVGGTGLHGPIAILMAVPALVILAVLPGARPRLTLLAMVLLTLLGMWRVALADHGVSRSESAHQNWSTLTVEVVGQPRRFPERTSANLRIIGGEDQTVEASLPPYPTIAPGDTLRLRGQLTDGQLYVASLTKTANSADRWQVWRNRLDHALHRNVERHVPEPAAALVLGVMIGDDDGMTEGTRAAFRGAGMSHITAVSGWNVALLAALIGTIGRRRAMTSWWFLGATLVWIWSYAYVVGMVPTVTRAAIMASLVLVARSRGRPGDALTAMLLAAAGMLALDPEIRSDVGFQLSFVATLGLILANDALDGWPPWKTTLSLPLVAQLAVLPLLLHHFGSFSMLSPVANLLAAPLVPATMFAGLAVGLGSLIHPAIGDACGVLAWIPSRLIVAVAEATTSISWASGTTRTLSDTATVGCYVVVAAAWFAFSIMRRLDVSGQRAEAIERV